MTTYLTTYFTGLLIWINTAIYFVSLSALSGAVFFVATIPLVAVCSIKAAAIVTVKYSNEV